MTYPVKLSEPDRSPAGLFWLLAIVLTGAWVFFAYSNPDFTPTSRLHTPLLSSLSILIIAAAVWHWSGRWWVLLLVFTSPFILWPLHTTILDTLPLLGLLIFTFFAPQADYAHDYANRQVSENPKTTQRFLGEIAAAVLLLVQPQAAGLAGIIIWLRSGKKWWLGGIALLAATAAYFYLWPWPLIQPNSFALMPFWPWTILVGVVLFWIGIGQRDVLISGASTLFFWPTLLVGSVTTVAIVTAVRLPKLFIVLSASAWVILTLWS